MLAEAFIEIDISWPEYLTVMHQSSNNICKSSVFAMFAMAINRIFHVDSGQPPHFTADSRYFSSYCYEYCCEYCDLYFYVDFCVCPHTPVFTGNRPRLHLRLKPDSFAGKHKLTMAKMMQRLPTFHRRIKPGFDHLQHKPAVFFHHASIDYPAFKAGKTRINQRRTNKRARLRIVHD